MRVECSLDLRSLRPRSCATSFNDRSSARVCVEPENPELLDVSCLDEVVDCEFQTSHEHVDLDQGEAKDRLRTD